MKAVDRLQLHPRPKYYDILFFIFLRNYMSLRIGIFEILFFFFFSNSRMKIRGYLGSNNNITRIKDHGSRRCIGHEIIIGRKSNFLVRYNIIVLSHHRVFELELLQVCLKWTCDSINYRNIARIHYGYYLLRLCIAATTNSNR
jgi:hypothetical protein